jgi:uncharacterized protein
MPSGFFAVLDDIAILMDDVLVMSKIATKKTAGILGDDLAVNAEKASGFVSTREIPVLWAIAKGSAINKLIILPLAFILSAVSSVAVVVILVLGGIYLAYEGAEKIVEFFFHRKTKKKESILIALSEEEILKQEKLKIKSAIITDFILSVEIVIIALGTVIDKPLSIQIMVVTIVAIIATIGVYSIVALIVRMDDMGLYLTKKGKSKYSLSNIIGNLLINLLPLIIKGLAVVGTLALLLVAGGIFIHNISYIHHLIPKKIPTLLADFVVGLIVGLVALMIVKIFKLAIGKK